MSVTINGNAKLEAISCSSLSWHRRKMVTENLKQVELRSFRSVSSSIRWLRTNASIFRAFYSSWLQQKAPSPILENLVAQINSLRLLKKLGTSISYKRPPSSDYKLTVIVFADASRKNDHGQLCFISGLLFGKLASGSVIHVISWSSEKSRRPVKSIPSAKIFATGDAIDEGKALVKALNELLNMNIELWIAVDSKDLFTTLSTCRLASYRSIRGHVSSIRFEFATK